MLKKQLIFTPLFLKIQELSTLLAMEKQDLDRKEL